MRITDNYSAWLAHDAKMEKELERCPVCPVCGEPIQEERCYDGDELYPIVAELLERFPENKDLVRYAEQIKFGGAICERCGDDIAYCIADIEMTARLKEIESSCKCDAIDWIEDPDDWEDDR